MVLLCTKKEAASPAFSSTSPETEKSTASSPKSAIGKLCRKLSPRKNDAKRPLALTPEAPYCSPFERVFQYFDLDGDGKISPKELRSCMRSVGEELSVEDAGTVVEANDSDGDGLLGLDDFLRLMEVEGEEEKRKDLVEAFGMYKMEGLGCITPKSLKRMLSRLGESKTVDECKTMISRFDLDGDGVLSFEEFRVMMV
ncbi:putative calcium-binding protein CML19 [Aristolochia californica]|uniref:putative calcium-binding protein CML19 n=1 Tax=Aristolochia californica TaxID=171875 RepID=UPI0035D6FBFA